MTLTPTETDFLAASREAEQVAERSAAEQARRQAVLIRRLRLVLAGAVVLLVLALVAGGFAAVQSDRAERNAAEAQQTAVSADARRVGLRSELTDDISLALLLAVAGVRLDESPETRANLLAALSKRPTLVRSEPPAGGYMEGFVVSPDGRWIASSDDQNRMHLYDASTNRLLRSYDAGRFPEDQQAWVVGAFSPDSRQLAVVPTNVESTEPVRLLDPNTMESLTTQLASPAAEPVVGGDVQFSADGHYLAATMLTDPPYARTDKFAVVWDMSSPSTPPLRVPTGRETIYDWMTLSPDGQTLYTSDPLTAYTVATGERIWRREEIYAGSAFDINADGNLLAVSSWLVGEVLLVDPASGDTVRTLRGQRDHVRDIKFSRDGTLVAATGSSYELTVWDTATGRLSGRWFTFDEFGVGFSPDNDLVYSGGGSGTMLRTWDQSMADTYLQSTTQVDDADLFVHADISPDGKQVAYSWLDDQDRGWVRFVDVVTGDATSPTRFPVWDGAWFNVVDAWHPDGGQYVGYWCENQEPCATPGTVTVVDSTTGEVIQKRDIFDGNGDVYSLGYVDGGRSLLAGVTDGKTHLIDAGNLSPRGEPFDFEAGCCTTPIGDGSTVMVYEWSADALSTHWRALDLGNSEVLSEGDLDLFAQASAVSPDGATVAVAGDTGQIVTIDVSTGDEERRSTGVGANVLWLEYSDDGELLVTGDADGGASLWDAMTLDLLGTVFPPHLGEPVPAGVQFIGDSHDVAIASYDGTVYRWETDVERAIDFACQMAGRDLTEEEWAEFLPTQPYREVCPGL
jgi:WD40 repeat protein